jgi:Spy/CpxP family protein refolding chaperone
MGKRGDLRHPSKEEEPMIRSKLTALIVLSALAGCSAAATPDPNTTAHAATAVTGVDMAVAPVAVASHGRVKRIADALSQVPLRPDQRSAIEALAADAETRTSATATSRHDFAEALATQVASGALDRQALAPKITALATSFAAAHAKDRAAFETLHTILEPDQRAAFIDAMEAARHDGPHGEGMGIHGGHFWADALGLTDAQREAFRQIMHDSFGAMHDGKDNGGFAFHGHHALLEGFRGESFSFDTVSPPEDMAGHMTTRVGHLLDVAEKVLPLLTAEQRALAAQKIRDHLEQLPL